MDKKVIIGKIVNTRGLKGEVIVHTFTESPQNFLDYENYYLSVNGVLRPIDLISKKFYKGSRVVIQIKGVFGIDAAEDLKEAEIYIEARDLSAAAEDEFYYHDAIGAAVYQSGKFLGNVVDVLNHGSCDILEVENAAGKRIFTPVLKQYLQRFDLEAGEIEYNLDYEISENGEKQE